MTDTVKDPKNLPEGIALTPLDDAFRLDPYAVLKRIQTATPVHEDTQLKRFIYTHHDDVKAILRDPNFWSDPRKGNPGTFMRELLGQGLRDDEDPSMLLMDEPDHRRLRSLVSASFTPAAVEQWRDRARVVVDQALDKINSEEFDLINDFAGPVPTVVIAELLGIDPSMHDKFKYWSDEAVKVSFNPFASEEEKAVGDAAGKSLEQFFVAEIETRRDDMGDDLISDMIRAKTDGDKLTVDEMVRQCNLLLIAGNVTTTDLIGNGVKALLENPNQLQSLRDDPSMIKNAVEEMLRYDSPVVNSARIANRDIDIAGCPVQKGESLNTSLAAANRDPSVYPNPDKFDITRADNHHQSFGGGRHLCLGAHLARVEAQEAILGLLRRYPNLALSDKGYTYHAIPSFRGMANCWISTSK
ncbi:MAG: cytochrome P450 [Candidatus Azotimanducaceae bacterium]|jgi:cytochrome P450